MSSTNKNRNSEWFRVESFRALPQKLKLQADKLWYENFRVGKSQQELKETEDKFFSVPFAFLLAIEDNSVIGALCLFKREINYRGERIILGGLGGLCTKKEKRRMGVATALLRMGMKGLTSQECDVAYLCTDIRNLGMIKLYAQVGFVLLNKSYTYLGKSGKRYTERNGMIASVKSKEKFDFIMREKKVLDLGVGNW